MYKLTFQDRYNNFIALKINKKTQGGSNHRTPSLLAEKKTCQDYQSVGNKQLQKVCQLIQ